jgi:hypothetical protein
MSKMSKNKFTIINIHNFSKISTKNFEIPREKHWGLDRFTPSALATSKMM